MILRVYIYLPEGIQYHFLLDRGFEQVRRPSDFGRWWWNVPRSIEEFCIEIRCPCLNCSVLLTEPTQNYRLNSPTKHRDIKYIWLSEQECNCPLLPLLPFSPEFLVKIVLSLGNPTWFCCCMPTEILDSRVSGFTHHSSGMYHPFRCSRSSFAVCYPMSQTKEQNLYGWSYPNGQIRYQYGTILSNVYTTFLPRNVPLNQSVHYQVTRQTCGMAKPQRLIIISSSKLEL